ncbi:MAG: molybdopterin-dependent oxidoreductase [Acidobacteria bacterium]|nr:molybdopterin-dependent oxidoreductase [Acidobacteriota bacterium]
MAQEMTRREILGAGLAAASLLAIGVPEWALPALAQGETLVSFTDIPVDFNPGDPNSPVRIYDIRNISIENPLTPRDEFFSIAHYGLPEIEASTFRLQVTGLVDSPREFSLEDIQARPSVELGAGYECSGNSGRRVHGLASNGWWAGTRLSELLKDVGVRPEAREVVFFGADHGEREVTFRNQSFKLDQQFARSMSIENAMEHDALIAYALNGELLTPQQGFPMRLVMPGWYGVANVKWLSGIHVQENRFVGHYQARWYRTVMGERIGGDIKFMENEVTRMQLKSVIARVTTRGSNHQILGFVLNDGTPLRSVEVKVDDGPWQTATLAVSNSQYSWKLFTYLWQGAAPGEHTLVSRATDIHGQMQLTEADLENKRTFLEHSAQFPRTVLIA